LFSHVSPTSSVHVFNDFYDQNVTIVNGEICEFGIESTVIKIIGEKIEVFREGSLSVRKL
jgi:tRNA A37 threonylcarbamoyladenosine synthetase subunit TsaC/SUA5/YrdC